MFSEIRSHTNNLFIYQYRLSPALAQLRFRIRKANRNLSTNFLSSVSIVGKIGSGGPNTRWKIKNHETLYKCRAISHQPT